MTLTVGSMQEMVNKLNSLFTKHDIPLISWVDMEKLDSFDKLDLGDGITSVKLPLSTVGNIVFRVVFNKGAELLNHRHDCKEIITVEKGNLVIGSGIKKSANEKIIFQAYTPHSIRATEKTVCYVEFIEPTKKPLWASKLF